MNQRVSPLQVKLFVMLVLLVVVACGCSSTISVRGERTYGEMNEELKEQHTKIELIDGKEILVKEAKISGDSLSWIDPRTNEKCATNMEQVNKIVIVKRTRFWGALEGLGFGLVAGAGVGGILAGQGSAGDTVLQRWHLGLIEGGLFGGGIGLITGAILGHSYIYEYERKILTDKPPMKPDTLYLKNGSIVRGTILAEIREGNIVVRVSIREADGEIHTYDASEIERIEKAE